MFLNLPKRWMILFRTSRKNRDDSSKFQGFTVDFKLNLWSFVRNFPIPKRNSNLPKLSWKEAEDLAARYLESQGYRIVGRNVKTPFGEIDIVAVKRGHYVFAEVKSGYSERIKPAERVDREKYLKILDAAEYYLSKRKFRSVRVDVIEVTKDGIRHYENVGWEYS